MSKKKYLMMFHVIHEEKVRVMNKNYWDERREERKVYNKEYCQREIECEVCECKVRKCNWGN